MASDGDYTNAGDKLWAAVMQNEIEAHGNPQGKKWRSVSKQTVACDSCKDSGATVLLRCGHEKCPREYHVDCAFHQGGLSLDEKGVLNVLCESHFKPLLFCSCKEPYDDTRPMVYCDECFDWFHNKCEGLSASEAQSIDKYTCKNCREILRQGRAVSKHIKEKNEMKETRSVHQQSASKAVGLLSELEGGLCPIIDEIGTVGKSQWVIKDIEEARSVVCLPPFLAGESAMSDMDAQSAELLNKLGVMPVIDLWRKQLISYLDRYHQWFSDARAFCDTHLPKVGTHFGKAQVAFVEEVRAGLVGFSERAARELVGTPTDLEGFAVFLDSVTWLAEFLQVLHQTPKADNWLNAVNAFLRTGAMRYKQLAAHSKDAFCGAFAEPFQAAHKAATAQVLAMNAWYTETSKILSTGMDYSLADLDTYLHSADDFPAQPMLFGELATVVTEAWALEGDIATALADPASSAQLLSEIAVKKTELGVTLPSEPKLNAASERHVFLQACDLALAQPRLRSELVLGLVAQAEGLLAAKAVEDAMDVDVGDLRIASAEDAAVLDGSEAADVSSVLYEALGQRVREVVAVLQGMMAEAAEAVKDLGEHLVAHSDEPQRGQLVRLRALKVITPEEELLEFIQTAKSLQAKALHTVPTLRTDSHDGGTIVEAEEEPFVPTEHASLTAVQHLVEHIEATLKNTVVDRFEISHRHKTALAKLHTTLVDQQVAAERLWGAVESAVQDCDRGVAVSQELLQEALARAEETKIRNESVAQRAAALLQRAQAEEARFLETLQGVRDASEESVHTARTMVDTAHYLPLTAEAAQRITQRSTVCTAVFESQRILAQSSSSNSAALSEREMHTLRELSHTINKLATVELVSPELELLDSVKEPILLFLWRAEVHFLWLHPIAPAAAEQIRAHGEQLGDAARNCPEWAELCAEIERGATFLQAAETLIRELDEAKAISADDVSVWHAVAEDLEQRLTTLATQDASVKIKTPSVSAALSEGLDLVSSMRLAQLKLAAVRAEMMSTAPMTRPVADFREITYFVNKLSALVEKHSSFQLLRSLREEMGAIHSAAAQWNESTSTLLPQQKATRNKLKPEAAHPTLSQVMGRLCEPIARAVSTPMHEKFKQLLIDVDAFRMSFVTFLLPPEFPIKDTANFQSPDFSAKLREDMVTIGEMKKQAELIPLDLPEFRVLNWVSALFEWINSIPYPGDDPKLQAIPMDEALKKVEESAPIVGTIPGNVIETLCQLGAMNLDETAGPVGFHANIHPYFNLAGDLSDHLEQQVKHSEQLQLRIKQAIDSKHPAKELLQLQEDSAALLVQLSAPIRKALDRTLGKSSGRGGAQRGGAQDESESSEYSGAEEEEEEVEADNYWTEKSVLKPKSTKRARDAVDSLVSVKRPPPAERKIEVDKPKKSRSNCTNPECPTTALKARHSLYCSNHCAMVTSSQVLSALVAYRKQLCLYGAVQRRLVTVEDPYNTLSKVSDADWKAFSTTFPAANEAVADIVSGMKGAGFIAESLTPSRPNPRTGDSLEIFLQDGERRAQAENGGAPVIDTSNPADRKTSYIHTFLSALPPAAGPVFLRGDAEGLATHTAAVKAAGGTPVTAKSSFSNNVDEELRLKIRYGLEETLERTLSRLQVAGAANHAAFIAIDFEDELCLKYASAESKAAKKGPLVFDKKEYRKHYLMLVSNLRKAHNDQLILKLVSNEISIENLLEMTAVQLADSSTQQRRQQQLSNVVLDALRESTQETLEAARRQVMGAGTEEGAETRAVVSAHNDSDSQRMSLSLAAGSADPELPSPKHSLRPEALEVDDSGMDVANDDFVEDSSSSTSSRSLEIEKKVSAAAAAASPRGAVSGATPKRPIDADAISRFTSSSSKPNKQPRIEGADGSSESSEVPTKRTLPAESPRVKPTALLSSILSNKAAVAAASASPRAASNNTTDFHYEDISAASLRAPSTSSARSNLTKLINSDGGNEISIVRPGHGSSAKNIVMKGEAIVGDRKLQGVLTTPCNIDGRVKLDEFKRIINKVLTLLEDPRSAHLPNRKHLSVFKMTVQADAHKDGSTSYDLFCTEFSRDLRVGYSNLGGGNSQLYVLPPAHKNCLPIFACLEESGADEKNILYGVLTSKDTGPEEYTREDPSEGSFSWETTPSLAPPLPTASSGSGGIAMSKGAPPPPAPPAVKVSKVSKSVPPPLPPRAPAVTTTTAVAAPAAATVPDPTPAPAPPAAVPKPVEDPILRVATFVATRGIQMMRELQAKPETRSVMPFLFDSHVDHSKFLIALKAAMEQKNAK